MICCFIIVVMSPTSRTNVFLSLFLSLADDTIVMISEDATSILQTTIEEETTNDRVASSRPEGASEQTRVAITEAKLAELDQKGNFSYDGLEAEVWSLE